MTAKVLRSGCAALCGSLVAAMLAGACSRDDAPPQAPVTGSESNTPITVKGTERVAWDQPAFSGSKLAQYRFLLYVDDQPPQVAADATCSTTPSPNSMFPCTAKLPKLSAGAHRLQLAAEETGGERRLGPRSGVLLLDVVPRTTD